MPQSPNWMQALTALIPMAGAGIAGQGTGLGAFGEQYARGAAVADEMRLREQEAQFLAQVGSVGHFIRDQRHPVCRPRGHLQPAARDVGRRNLPYSERFSGCVWIAPGLQRHCEHRDLHTSRVDL